MPPKRSRNSCMESNVDVGTDDDEESDSDSDVDVEEFNGIVADGAALSRPILNAAALGRVNPHTREAYDLNISQCASWALSSDSFKHEVVTGFEGEMLKLKWPLNVHMVIGYVDFLENKQVCWPFTEKKKHLAPSTIAHFFSAFRDQFNVHSQPVSEELTMFFSNTYRKYVLHISQKKLEGLYPDTTNSVGFSACIYEKICGALVGYWKKGKGATNSAVRYMRLFFIFCYVLLGRGERIGRLRFTWMCWSDDSMMLKIPTSKSDQAGALSYSKRVYANPMNPSVCPILALAVEVFCRSCSTFTDRVFPSAGCDYHVASHSASFKYFLFKTFGQSCFGINTHSITNHSSKRSGIMSVTNAEAIHWHSAELRADHKVGITSNYQTSASPQQDGVMGRILSCLPLGDAMFNVAPPHFVDSDISHIPWAAIVPHYDSYESQFRFMIPFLFASLIHNWDWLQDTMPADHPFLVSKLAVLHKNLISELKPKLLGGFVGARSVLTVTGNSTFGDMHVDIKATGRMVSDIHSVVCGGSHFVIPSPNGTVTVPRDHYTILTEIRSSVQQVVDQNNRILKIAPAYTPATTIATYAEVLGQRPVYYLPSSWRLINGIKPEGLFLKWFIADGNTCAWERIHNSMLPIHEGRRAQESLLSKYRTVMECLIGTTRAPMILRDVASSFTLCWDRIEKECGWTSCLKNDSCITLYGKIPKDKMQHLKSTPVPGFNSNAAIFAATLAVHAATMAQNAALAFTSASLPQVAVLANELFQSTMQLAQDQVGSSGMPDIGLNAEMHSDVGHDDAVIISDEGRDDDPIIPSCVPRGAVLYPLEAPRPPIDRNDGCLTTCASVVLYNSFVATNSPRSGSAACWVCPHCLTANSSGAFQVQGVSMRRHVRDNHKSMEYNSDDFNCYLHRSRLVWCHKGDRAKNWQPVILSTE